MKTTTMLLLWGIALLGVLPDTPARADEENEPAELPLSSEGDLVFYVDTSGYEGVNGETDQEFYVSISNEELRFQGEEEQGEVLAGKIDLSIVLRKPDGKKALELKSELEPQAGSRLDAEDRYVVQMIRESGMVAPGMYHLEVTVRDQRALKRGLINKVRRTKKDGVARGWIEVPDFAPSGLSLSDLTLVRSAERVGGETPFGRNGVEFDPNPSRLYGMRMPRAQGYVEVYGGEKFNPGDSFLVRLRLEDLTGTPVLERKARARSEHPDFVLIESLDLTVKTPPGSYYLAVEVENETTGEAVEARARLELVWAEISWGQDEKTILEEMKLVMSDKDYKSLQKLSPGPREIFLAEYWHALDPDPDTPYNETYVEFRRRIQVADTQFGATLQRGMLTDRGRVYVRYGPPDDVDYQFSSSSFGDDPTDAKVSTPTDRATLSTRPSGALLDPDEFQEGDVRGLETQRGGTNIEAKALEIWRYDGQGRTLTGRKSLDSDSLRGLEFIFADEIGNGNFILIGSTGASIY